MQIFLLSTWLAGAALVYRTFERSPRPPVGLTVKLTEAFWSLGWPIAAIALVAKALIG
jgi:hypothetical protein